MTYIILVGDHGMKDFVLAERKNSEFVVKKLYLATLSLVCNYGNGGDYNARGNLTKFASVWSELVESYFYTADQYLQSYRIHFKSGFKDYSRIQIWMM